MTFKKWKRKYNQSYSQIARGLDMTKANAIKIVNNPTPYTPIQTIIKIYNYTAEVSRLKEPLTPWDFIDNLPKLIKSHRKFKVIFK